ncbi:hypothetical protein, partial [Xanthobacter autotrophicus]|uniref:hypothetical protein n=1 Tax=Xanthobacter autotrophicus TaxID=280 RepID=UPI0024A6CEAB
MFGASRYGAKGFRLQDEGLARPLARLMALGLLGASLAVALPAWAEQPDPPAAAPVTSNAGMGTGDAPLTTPLPPVMAPV